MAAAWAARSDIANATSVARAVFARRALTYQPSTPTNGRDIPSGPTGSGVTRRSVPKAAR